MDPSLEIIRGSDGSGNASVATVQSTRTAPATTIVVDTVAGIPDTFVGSMGTPHTFTDPVTGETITVISEATAVDFRGHVDGSNLEIDEIAPGYTDAGSAVGDIIVIRPTTQWADNVAEVLGQQHNDDGSHKDITTNSITTDELIITGNDVTAGWAPVGVAVNSVTNNGNRSYDLEMASTMAAVLSPGMRLKTTRTVAAPTQCADLEAGSSQYFSKSSPAGCTFTDDYTIMAWIKLESYNLGTIINRRDASTAGWELVVLASGQLQIGGYRIAANNRQVVSTASLPLGRWVHVAATMNHSANTHTMYFDGVAVNTTTTTNGTITAIVQPSVDLRIGSLSSSVTNLFDGKIAQAAVFSSVLDAATIRSYMSQTLSGSETDLVSAYSFNNSIADLNTSNANDLTANGGAVATDADSPFGVGVDGAVSSTTDYGLVVNVDGTTVTCQVPEGNTIPTSGGVTTLEYSVMAVPFGFPRNKDRWALIFQEPVATTTRTYTASPTGAVWYALTSILKWNFPVGDWSVIAKGGLLAFDRTAGGSSSGIIGALSESSSAPSNLTATTYGATAWNHSAAGTEQYQPRIEVQIIASFSFAAATDMYLIAMAAQSGADLTLTAADPTSVATSFLRITAIPEYL